MNYTGSTQARHWLFTMESLQQCRQQAVRVNINASAQQPRKFASGYHRRTAAKPETTAIDHQPQLSVEKQECIVRFHLQQLEILCGPTACLESLRTSEKVLFTAITFVRRFYLSNSVLEFHPRHICAAAVFLAGKVEEEKVELCQLSHATLLHQSKFLRSPLHGREFSFVTTTEIECAEKLLMEGLNYELISHQATDALREVASNLTMWIRQSATPEESGASLAAFNSFSVYATVLGSVKASGLLKHFLDFEKRLLMLTDMPFLVNPATAAYAIAAVALGSFDSDLRLGELMQDYLVTRYALETEDALVQLYREVNQVIEVLVRHPVMGAVVSSTATKTNQSVRPTGHEVQQTLILAERLRSSLPTTTQAAAWTTSRQGPRKRKMGVGGGSKQRDTLERGRSTKLVKITP